MIATGTPLSSTGLAIDRKSSGVIGADLSIAMNDGGTWFSARAGVAKLVRIPSHGLLALISLYQRFVSPLVPVVTLGACACRFAPSCSQYAAEAVRTHGALRGSLLAFKRLAKCTPLHPGGLDPVPPRRSRPLCHSATR